jgi:hypothetical protein
MVHESPLSVRVTGWFTVTLATLGMGPEDICADAEDASTTAMARNAERKRVVDFDIKSTFQINLARDGLELSKAREA